MSTQAYSQAFVVKSCCIPDLSQELLAVMAPAPTVNCGGVEVSSRLAWWAVIVMVSTCIGAVLDSFQKVRDDQLDKSSATIDDLDLDDWTPHHVALWMEREGFGRYAQSFIDQSIEGDRLCELEASHLQEAGMTDSKEQARLFHAVAVLRKSKVNDRNPTANGFWEYRSVNRGFVAVALPGIVVSAHGSHCRVLVWPACTAFTALSALPQRSKCCCGPDWMQMCPRTWVLVTFFLDNENIEHILNPDSRRTAADDPRNNAGWTAILDSDEGGDANATGLFDADSGDVVAQPKMSNWREQARLSTVLALAFFPHGVAAIWLLGFADTDPLLVMALVLALGIAQLKEFLDVYHMLTSDIYVSKSDKGRFWAAWAIGTVFTCVVFLLVRVMPHTLLDAGFYAYVAAACLHGATELFRLARKTINEGEIVVAAVQRGTNLELLTHLAIE